MADKDVAIIEENGYFKLKFWQEVLLSYVSPTSIFVAYVSPRILHTVNTVLQSDYRAKDFLQCKRVYLI